MNHAAVTAACRCPAVGGPTELRFIGNPVKAIGEIKSKDFCGIMYKAFGFAKR